MTKKSKLLSKRFLIEYKIVSSKEQNKEKSNTMGKQYSLFCSNQRLYSELDPSLELLVHLRAIKVQF